MSGDRSMVNGQSAEPSGERREFFRIDDRVALSYQVLSSEGLAERLARRKEGLENEFTIMGNLSAISQEMSGALRKIEGISPDIARYLKSLDQKIDLLGRAFLTLTNDMDDQPASTVNLSASGMAFDTPSFTENGTLLELKLLLPVFTGLILYAEVVACETVPAGNGAEATYQTRVNFLHLRESDRDVLIRHVLQRQSESLRRRKQQTD